MTVFFPSSLCRIAATSFGATAMRSGRETLAVRDRGHEARAAEAAGFALAGGDA